MSVRTIEVNGISTRIIEKGQGVPVLFLHGNPDNAEEWNKVIDLLQQECRCIAIDLPGFYHSTIPSDYDFSVDSQVRFVDALIATLELEKKIVIVAHDIGAVMGVAWAATRPERVRGLVVMNTVYHRDYHWHVLARIWAIPILGRLSMMIPERVFINAFRKTSPNLETEEIRRIYQGITVNTKRSILRLYRKMVKPEFFVEWDDRMAEITRHVPSMVIWGKQDSLIPSSYAQRIGPNVRMLEQSNHWVPLEAPDEIANNVRRFLR